LAGQRTEVWSCRMSVARRMMEEAAMVMMGLYANARLVMLVEVCTRPIVASDLALRDSWMARATMPAPCVGSLNACPGTCMSCPIAP
jgi:hypothetical protein